MIRLPAYADPARQQMPGRGPGEAGSLTYQVLLPAFVVIRLNRAIDTVVRLQTLHFFESINQGAVLLPRLAGFLATEDRRFYELFTTCKGIGHRRALRALTLSTEQIAAAILDRDLALLQTLPEVGRRTAETIVTALRDKVQPFISVTGPRGGDPKDAEPVRAESGNLTVAREALNALLQLGESRTDAVRWIDLALSRDEENRPEDTQALLSRIYQIKSRG